jgi:hypothetical protein
MQFNGGTIMQNPLTVLVLEDLVIDIPMPTNGTPPYFDYSIQLFYDTVTTNGSPNGGGSIPAEILLINSAASTINSTDPLLYDDMHTMDYQGNLPPNTNLPADLEDFHIIPGDGVNTFNTGSFYVDKIILSVPGTPGNSYSVLDITLQVSAEDANGDVVTSSVSIDMATELGI